MRISFCTACMGRLEHLRQTLPANMALASDPAKYEFVVLDYNSADGLAEWIQSNFKEQIQNGLLNYYRTSEPEFFLMSHSKNISHLLAESEIVCNLDADNFLTSQFLNFIHTAFSSKDKKISMSFDRSNVGSRLAMYKSEFIKVGGYDEDFTYGWGAEDSDLVLRLNHLGYRRITTYNLNLLGSDIPHSDLSRNALTRYKLDKNVSAQKNTALLIAKHKKGRFYVNQGRKWGVATVEKNFSGQLQEISSYSSGISNVSDQVWSFFRESKLSQLDLLSFASMVENSYQINLICMKKIENLPAYIKAYDISEILPQSLISKKRDSELLELMAKAEVLLKHGGWWVDPEVVILQPLNKLVTDSGYLFFELGNYTLQTIMHLPPQSQIMHSVKWTLEEINDKRHPRIPASRAVNNILSAIGIPYAKQDALKVMPIRDKAWKDLILPGESLPENTLALHHWGRIMKLRGIRKNTAFENNSILGRLITKFGVNQN